MVDKQQHKVPEPTLKRLPVYLHYLKRAYERGILTISAPQIGKELNCDPTQVVKDLATTGVKGRPRVGYSVHELIQAIEGFLGFDLPNEAFLVGAGNLGTALMSYPDFKSYGINIVAAFDSDASRIGRSSSGVNIIHMDKLPELAQRLKVRIAILTTPAGVAQEVAEHLVECGIAAIWNLTPTRLNLPEKIVVQNTSMYANVAVMLKKLKDTESDNS